MNKEGNLHLKIYIKTFATVLESNTDVKFSTNGLLLKANFYHFPNSGNHPHICLDILFREVSNHGNQCHQVMPLEMDNQFGHENQFL